ncbi:MAG: FmdE family protein [Sphaerochaetaceae bacterium]
MESETLWKDCINFHGHSCPGLAMGFRAALTALKILGLKGNCRAVDEELVCVSENDACGVDAIQWITGCTTGKGNMNIHLTGKQAWSFYDRRSDKSVRLVLKPFDRTKMTREETLNWLLNSPAEELFEIKSVRGPVPEKARMFNSIVCTKCGEAAREDLIRLQNGKPYCLDCFDPYNREV